MLRKELLAQLLSKSNIKHKKEILKEETLKDALIYCKINNLSGAISGPLVELYVQHTNKYRKNSKELAIGDFCLSSGRNIEFKFSSGGQSHTKFNFVQLRMNHDCDYIFTAYLLTKQNLEDEGEMFLFYLKKNDVKDLLLTHGSYAHGTIKNNGKITRETLFEKDNTKEYALRPKYGDDLWLEMLKFRVENFLSL
jgi:hypothetical protein